MRARALVVAFAVLAGTAAACGGNGDGAGGGSAAGGAAADAGAGAWKTYVIGSPASIAVPAPPTGQAAKADAEEVLRVSGGARSAEDEALIKQWNQELSVRPWVELNMELVSHGGVKDPPTASRTYAMTSVAIYDAVVAAWHWKYQYNRPGPEGSAGADAGAGARVPSYPSEHAAMAGAASVVLEYGFPDAPFGTFDDLARKAADSRVKAGLNYRSDVEAGLALGRAVGEKVLTQAKADGSDRPWDGSRPAGVGRGPQYWEDPPGVITPPTHPEAAGWKTWVLSSGSQFRSPPPPAYESPKFLEEAREVIDVAKNLTDEQKKIASFWAGGAGTALPPGLWDQVALDYASRSKFSTPRAARLFAALNVGEADAAIAVWDTKFTYWSPRPINAIRDLGLDPAWRPYLGTPIFPSYVSGHAGFSGAAATILSYFFPSDAALFEAKAQEAALSRLYGGIHFRSDNEVGLQLGDNVGKAVVDRLKGDGASG